MRRIVAMCLADPSKGQAEELQHQAECDAQLKPPGKGDDPMAVDVQIETYSGSFVKLP